MTIARELAKLTGYAVFHNHLVVDAVHAVFEFGSEPFVRLRHEMWLSVFREAALAERNLIFTFSPENTVPPTFVEKAAAAVEQNGGKVLFVRLLCSDEEQERRLDSPSRSEFGKLRSVELLRQIRAEGGGEFPEIAHEGLTIDTEQTPPAEAAQLIQRHFEL